MRPMLVQWHRPRQGQRHWAMTLEPWALGLQETNASWEPKRHGQKLAAHRLVQTSQLARASPTPVQPTGAGQVLDTAVHKVPVGNHQSHAMSGALTASSHASRWTSNAATSPPPPWASLCAAAIAWTKRSRQGPCCQAPKQRWGRRARRTKPASGCRPKLVENRSQA